MSELHHEKKSMLRGALRRRGIYLLPNLFTTLVLFFGFYAIVQAMNHRWDHAAVAVFVAMVMDGLDGRIARMTRTQSEFGAQYDSIADMVAFGAAPALISYEWALRPLGRYGWIVAFAYCAGAALRLARFNANIDVVDKRYFQGLPSPAAAALVAGMVWVAQEYGIATDGALKWVAAFVTLFAGVTMVTNLPFYSGKDINFRRSVPFWVVLAIVLGLIVISVDPALVLFGLFVAYALSGYVLWVSRHRSRPPF
jgi:CDP-diacylglycerol---serine O-phosphatidyltransferase